MPRSLYERAMKLLRRAGAMTILMSLTGCAESDAGGASDLGSGQYAVATTQFSPEGQTSLLALVDDPTQDHELDLSRAAEFGGAAALFGPDRQGLFALGSSDAPVLTRYELQRGELTKGQLMGPATKARGAPTMNRFKLTNSLKILTLLGVRHAGQTGRRVLLSALMLGFGRDLARGVARPSRPGD